MIIILNLCNILKLIMGLPLCSRDGACEKEWWTWKIYESKNREPGRRLAQSKTKIRMEVMFAWLNKNSDLPCLGVKTLRKHIKIESLNYTMFLPHFYYSVVSETKIQHISIRKYNFLQLSGLVVFLPQFNEGVDRYPKFLLMMDCD